MDADAVFNRLESIIMGTKKLKLRSKGPKRSEVMTRDDYEFVRLVYRLADLAAEHGAPVESIRAVVDGSPTNFVGLERMLFEPDETP